MPSTTERVGNPNGSTNHTCEPRVVFGTFVVNVPDWKEFVKASVSSQIGPVWRPIDDAVAIALPNFSSGLQDREATQVMLVLFDAR
jgi:hypothetical protein